MTVKAFPKIFPLGASAIANIYEGPVEITEKVDGSQFVFGKISGRIVVRSKGVVIESEPMENDMFRKAWEAVHVCDRVIGLPHQTVFYAEYLHKPKHNTLAYTRTPRNHLALFAAAKIDLYGNYIFNESHRHLKLWADHLGFDTVPLLYYGVLPPGEEFETIKRLIGQESYLGGANIEGVVVKNYGRDLLIGGQLLPLSAGKFVSEEFKEVHRKTWSKEHTAGGKFESLKEQYRSPARWRKAMQRMRDEGVLTGDPRDIGELIKRVSLDLIEEERENISRELWELYGRDVVKHCTKGLAQWYKELLATWRDK